jgi:sulfate transport system permease protein
MMASHLLKINRDRALSSTSGIKVNWGHLALNTLGLGFLAVIVGFPLVNIFYQAFAEGVTAYGAAIQTPDALHAIALTLIITLVTVPLNTAFGILAAWLLARHPIPGRSLILGLIDLPLTISPVIVGLMMILLFSQVDSVFKEWVLALNLKIIFALPGMILVTVFITLPFVVREVLPALEAMEVEQEEVAKTLGANSWQVFWRVILPNIRWAVLYGVILCTARAMAEFGAVAVVSGRIIQQTNTLTLHVERTYMEYQTVAAFASASLLTVVALITIISQEILHQIRDKQN